MSVVETQSGKRRTITHATVASMVADRSLREGDVVETDEYLAGTGAGGNRYRMVAAGTGTANGGSYIDVTGPSINIQAKALWEDGKRSLLQYGADPAGAVDCIPALDAAYAEISAGNFRNFDLGQGTYTCATTMNMPTRIFSIMGRGDGVAGNAVTKFNFTQTDGTHCVVFPDSFTDTAAAGNVGPAFGGVWIDGNVDCGDGINWDSLGQANGTLRDMYVRDTGGYNYYLNEFYLGAVINVRGSISEKSSIYLRGNGVNIYAYIDSVQENGALLDSCRAISVEGQYVAVGNGGFETPYSQAEYDSLNASQFACVKMQKVTDSAINFYGEATFASKTNMGYTMDVDCRGNDITLYNVFKHVGIDKGSQNTIHGVNDNLFDRDNVSINIPNNSLMEKATFTSNWTATGATSFTKEVLNGKTWMKASLPVGTTEIEVVNTAGSRAWNTNGFAGQLLNTQFTIMTSREMISAYAGEENLNMDPNGASGKLDNFNSNHFELVTGLMTPRTIRSDFKVDTDGTFGFRLLCSNLDSSLDVYLTDFVWGTNIEERNMEKELTTGYTNSRHEKGDLVAIRSVADAVDLVYCEQSGGDYELWAPSTVYAQGKYIKTAAGDTFICIVGGESANSGTGPTAVLGAIDGAATWDYLEPEATFATAHP